MRSAMRKMRAGASMQCSEDTHAYSGERGTAERRYDKRAIFHMIRTAQD